jgi:hypothetical protein
VCHQPLLLGFHVQPMLCWPFFPESSSDAGGSDRAADAYFGSIGFLVADL